MWILIDSTFIKVLKHQLFSFCSPNPHGWEFDPHRAQGEKKSDRLHPCLSKQKKAFFPGANGKIRSRSAPPHPDAAPQIYRNQAKVRKEIPSFLPPLAID